MGRVFRWVLILAIVALSGAGVLVWRGIIVLPPQYDPWATLDIRAAPNVLTRLKLSRLDDAPAQCRAVLGDTRLHFTPVPDRANDAGCGLSGAVQVSRSEVAFNNGFTVTCPVAAAWMLFETHALQPAAERHFGQRVARVQHLGSYACRNVYGRAEGRRSEHATANAIDIAGFVLEDDTAISLLRDWNSETGRKAAFLRDLRDGACRFFNVVLERISGQLRFGYPQSLNHAFASVAVMASRAGP
ncbi:extensin family protein, partial [Azospirillum soli]|uniref:extensin-like domain-containing protein n=1 Tax=Azospirillum soli TaxID=1304799 RepID=UPI001AE44A89